MESAAQFIGMVSGGIAVSIAIYFQMVTKSTCPIKYIWGFFLVGSALMLINVGAIGADPLISVALETIVYLIILIAEIAAAYKLNEKLDNKDLDFLETDLLDTGM